MLELPTFTFVVNSGLRPTFSNKLLTKLMLKDLLVRMLVDLDMISMFTFTEVQVLTSVVKKPVLLNLLKVRQVNLELSLHSLLMLVSMVALLQLLTSKLLQFAPLS